MTKIEDMISAAKLQEMFGKKECKAKKVVLWVLTIVGVVAAVAAAIIIKKKRKSNKNAEDEDEDI